MQFLYIPARDVSPRWVQQKQLTVDRALHFLYKEILHPFFSSNLMRHRVKVFVVTILLMRKLRLKEVKGILQNQQLPYRERELCAVFLFPRQIFLHCTASRSAGSFTHSITHPLIDLTTAYKHIFYTQHGIGTEETMESKTKSCCHWACGPEGEIAINT